MVALGFLALVALGVSAARRAGRIAPRSALSAAALWLTVAVPSLIQRAVPDLLDHLGRSPARVGGGELWRLATSAVVQDGGFPGTVFNLVVLAVVAPTTVAVLGARGLWACFWIGAVGCNLLVLSLAPSSGAGNSMATLTLAVAAVALLARRTPSRPALLRLTGTVVVGALLWAAGDRHGFAVLVGVPLGLLLGGRAAGSRAAAG